MLSYNRQGVACFWFLIVGLILAACGGQSPQTPTAAPAAAATATASLPPLATSTSAPSMTPMPTSTPTPTPTPAATATAIKVSTATPEAQATLALGPRQKVDAGGFSFQTASEFPAQIRGAVATLGNSDSTILISMASASPAGGTQPLQTLLDKFVSNIGNDVKQLKTGRPYTGTIGGINGLSEDLTGVLFGDAISGRASLVSPSPARYFYAFGFAVNGTSGQRWEAEGRLVFEVVMGSVQFFKPVTNTGGSPCAISTDPTYGYQKTNAIRVGGGDFGGPPREDVYLNNLRGPQGQKISYTRQGSVDFSGTILDIYLVQGLKQAVTLYVDEYGFTEPQAPVGFTCADAFPLAAP
jgi:hypothetical protein